MNARRAFAAASREANEILSSHHIQADQLEITSSHFFSRDGESEYCACAIRGLVGERRFIMLSTENHFYFAWDTHRFGQVAEWLSLEYTTLVSDGYIFHDGKVIHRGGHTDNYERWKQ